MADRPLRVGDEESPGSVFTTVANWRDYSWVEWKGTWYAQKAEAFKAVIDLPRACQRPVEACLRSPSPIRT